ncbi:MAG: HD domain-containing protein [Ruminococcus sp.]
MVLEHLTNVSDMSGDLSKEMLREICRAAGRYHDIGKYAPAFQQRLMTGKFESSSISACGAIALDQMSKNKMEECVDGCCRIPHCRIEHDR